MTQYRTYIDDSTEVGQETISSIQQNGSEFGVGVSTNINCNNISCNSINASIVIATEGFISIGNTSSIQISLVGNNLTFSAVGIGSTTLILSS